MIVDGPIDERTLLPAMADLLECALDAYGDGAIPKGSRFVMGPRLLRMYARIAVRNYHCRGMEMTDYEERLRVDEAIRGDALKFIGWPVRGHDDAPDGTLYFGPGVPWMSAAR